MWWISESFPSAHLGVVFRLIRYDRGLSVYDLCALLDAFGYRCSPSEYARMEAGRAHSDDGERFLSAYTSALNLSIAESQIVVTQWSFDLLCNYFDERVAHDVLRLSIARVVELISSTGTEDEHIKG